MNFINLFSQTKTAKIEKLFKNLLLNFNTIVQLILPEYNLQSNNVQSFAPLFILMSLYGNKDHLKLKNYNFLNKNTFPFISHFSIYGNYLISYNTEKDKFSIDMKDKNGLLITDKYKIEIKNNKIQITPNNLYKINKNEIINHLNHYSQILTEAEKWYQIMINIIHSTSDVNEIDLFIEKFKEHDTVLKSFVLFSSQEIQNIMIPLLMKKNLLKSIDELTQCAENIENAIFNYYKDVPYPDEKDSKVLGLMREVQKNIKNNEEIGKCINSIMLKEKIENKLIDSTHKEIYKKMKI